MLKKCKCDVIINEKIMCDIFFESFNRYLNVYLIQN